MEQHELPFERQPMTRRRFVFLSAGVGAALMLPGCGGKSGEEALNQGTSTGAAAATYDGPRVDLAFWNGFTGGDGPFMRDMVKHFSQQHQNIQVKMNVQQWADYYQKVPQAVASGRGPDVGVMHVDQLATNAARNVIIPLDDVAKAQDLQEDDFAKVIWDAGIYQDKRYGIPLDTHPLGFYYNKALMSKAGVDTAPTTRDEYDDALQKLKSSGVEHPFWSPGFWPGFLMFQSLLWQFGGELYNEDATKATWNSDAGVEALTWQVDQIKKGYSPKNVALDAQYIAFKNEKNAFTWDGIWQTQDLKKTDLNWDVSPLPQIGDEKAVWANSHNLVIMNKPNQDDNKLKAGQVFLNWISEHSIDWAKGGQVPARNSVRDSAAFKKLKYQSTLAEQVDYVHYPPAVPGIGDAQAEIDQLTQRALGLKQTPKAALDEGAKRANKILEDNRKKYGTA